MRPNDEVKPVKSVTLIACLIDNYAMYVKRINIPRRCGWVPWKGNVRHVSSPLFYSAAQVDVMTPCGVAVKVPAIFSSRWRPVRRSMEPDYFWTRTVAITPASV